MGRRKKHNRKDRDLAQGYEYVMNSKKGGESTYPLSNYHLIVNVPQSQQKRQKRT